MVLSDTKWQANTIEKDYTYMSRPKKEEIQQSIECETQDMMELKLKRPKDVQN